MWEFFKQIWDNIVKKQEKEFKPSLEGKELCIHGNIHKLQIQGTKDFDEILLDPKKKTLLIVDDDRGISIVILNTIDTIKERYGVDLFKDFNIVMSLGSTCAQNAFEFSKLYQVDFAILDITLREIIAIKDLKEERIFYHALDGFDVGQELTKKNPDLKYRFLTSHNLEFKKERFKKLHEKFGRNLIDYYINKLDPNRYEKIQKFLYGESQNEISYN